MSKQKPFAVVSVLVISAAGMLSLRADPPEKTDPSKKQFPLLRQKVESQNIITDKEVAPLMHRKLDQAKAILEGLAMADHKKIERSARALKLLSLEAGWKVIQTEEYMRQSADFRRACNMIENAAKAEDENRAALCYVALTVRCVECHSYLRDNKIILANKPAESTKSASVGF